MKIPEITPVLPDWLEKAEKYKEPPPGVECRVVSCHGQTWYLPLTREDLAQREEDKKHGEEALRKEWAEWDAWSVLTLEEKVARLGPRPPQVPRPTRTVRG